MSFRSGGIMSGLDSSTLIQQLVSIERQPILRLQSRQGAHESQISKIGNLSAKLSDLKGALEAIDSRTKLLSLSASSSDETVLRATATGQANQGAYDVTVEQLARTEKDRSQAFSTSGDEVRAGTLTITVKDEDPVGVIIAEGDTLSDVVAAINASDAEVSASLVNDGTHTYMYIVASGSGHTVGGDADDAVVLSESYTGGSGSELQLTQVQQARNALFSVDGLDVEKHNNNVSDVIEGVTLKLVGTTAAGDPATSVTVSPDTETVEERIQDFVDSYNEVLQYLRAETRLDASASREESLAGDSTVARVRATLQSVVADAVDELNGSFDSLASLGIKTTYDGTLKVNATELTEALQSDFLGVASVFTHEETGLADRIVAAIEEFVDPLEGSLKARQDGIRRRIDLLQDQIEGKERRIESYEASLVRQFASLETMVAQFQYQGNYLAGALG